MVENSFPLSYSVIEKNQGNKRVFIQKKEGKNTKYQERGTREMRNMEKKKDTRVN
jgi:hypothetical protein